MKKEETIMICFFGGFICGFFGLIAVEVVTKTAPNQMEERWKAEAVTHGVGRFEADTNGVVHFFWNDKK